MDSRTGLNELRLRTCAIGYLKVPVAEYVKDPRAPAFEIVGTGFLVGQKAVLTNRHVIRQLNEAVEAARLPAGSKYVAFLRPDGAGIQQAFHEMDRAAIITEPKHLDLALVLFRAQEGDPIVQLSPVKHPAEFTHEVGDPVAVYGYGYGTALLKRDEPDREAVYRFGPILQRGYISAIAPYDHSGVVERLLLDVRTAQGMSGSPVFDPATGDVIGIHTSGRNAVEFAVPLSQGVLGPILALRDQQAESAGTSEMRPVSRSPQATGISSSRSGDPER